MAADPAPWRALLRPLALLSHLLVLAVVAVLVALGQWQWSELGERRADNERFAGRASTDPLDADELRALDDPDPEQLEFRRVALEGTYLADEEVLLEGRSFENQAGRHSFVPLALDDGTLVLVRRGWVPRELGDPPLEDAAPPSGRVRVEGYLERSVSPEGFGPRNPESGELSILQRADLDRLAPQLPGELYPMFVTLLAQDPPPVASPRVEELGLQALPIPVGSTTFTDEGPHLNYAVQWHSFALLALIAYGAWWRTRLRRGGEHDREGRAPDARRDAPADTTV